jgi:transcriptional regulator with XRE-family HTH domain
LNAKRCVKDTKHYNSYKASFIFFSLAMEKTTGQQLTALREAKDMTQDELAAKSGISRVQISRLENDEVEAPRRSTLDKLAKVLGVETTSLHPTAIAPTRRANVVPDVEAETLAQFENIILQEHIAKQNDELNTKDEELTKLRAMVAYLKSELGKFGGSLEAALHGLVPPSPRAGVLAHAG